MAVAHFPGITHVVTDIEGTTSSIDFVKEVLFPYARQALPAFLQQHWRDEKVQAQVRAASALAGQPLDTPETASTLLQCWIDEDRKATPLKALQGMIWKTGYEQGDYQAHLYDDTAPCLQRWFDAGKQLYVYSSGSVTAQQLFFRYSVAGDLTPLFSDYFDTTTGPKQDTKSYQAIHRQLAVEASQILFLSDVVAELDAAKRAGIQTVHLDRDHGAPTSSGGSHPSVTSFTEIEL